MAKRIGAEDLAVENDAAAGLRGVHIVQRDVVRLRIVLRVDHRIAGDHSRETRNVEDRATAEVLVIVLIDRERAPGGEPRNRKAEAEPEEAERSRLGRN